ncbi:TetR/AcrR family transcriptional regulator [Actinokineospora fastidiosa]|uniref:TetR family transcriptional regulator n=1 Tax=Actinokineospora fastidiosa TaxID=1816 RepID=A0A918GFP1_9PSEU|nr:TetR/AcrR family transcriptional regulator [Actinokineospora fastidiosa]GGS33787.1 TetR family transcriptional regulator [Actinokineospora fastidiosa]
MRREESRTRNRAALISTARELFLRDGYQATSIARIAAESGFTTGAVYSNFDGKAQLALVVLQEIQAERLAELAAVIDSADPVQGLADWTSAAMASGWPRLELEFALDVRGDAALVRAEADRRRALVDTLTEAVERRGLRGPIPVRTLVDAAVNLAIGLATRRVIDPTVTADSLIELTRAAMGLLSEEGGGAVQGTAPPPEGG